MKTNAFKIVTPIIAAIGPRLIHMSSFRNVKQLKVNIEIALFVMSRFVVSHCDSKT